MAMFDLAANLPTTSWLMVSTFPDHHGYGSSIPAIRCGITSWFRDVSPHVTYSGIANLYHPLLSTLVFA